MNTLLLALSVPVHLFIHGRNLLPFDKKFASLFFTRGATTFFVLLRPQPDPQSFRLETIHLEVLQYPVLLAVAALLL